MADPVPSEAGDRSTAQGEALFWRRARSVATTILSHPMASTVAIVLATAIVLAFIKTAAFHALLMKHGADPARLMAIAAEPPFLPAIDFNVRVALLLALAVVYVTRSARLFRQEAEGLVARVRRPAVALKRRDYAAFALEAVLTAFAVGVAYTRFDYATAILTAALAATILWRLATTPPARSASAFLLEITSSLGAFMGAALVGWRCASKWLSDAAASGRFGRVYRQMETFGFWYKDAPLLAIILLLAGLYVGYLEHGLGSSESRAARSARQRFPWIVLFVAVAAVVAVGMDLAFISSAEFGARCRVLALQAGQDPQSLCDVLRVHATQFIHQRDVTLLLGGVVVTGLFYGVLCYGASLVLHGSLAIGSRSRYRRATIKRS